MAMSRKHYREAAEIINSQVLPVGEFSPTEDVAVRDALKGVANGLAIMFKADNSNFNRERFMDACGLN